jgi:hypothetical protein
MKNKVLVNLSDLLYHQRPGSVTHLCEDGATVPPAHAGACVVPIYIGNIDGSKARRRTGRKGLSGHNAAH